MMRTKKKTYCAFCGKEIRWIRDKSSGKSVPVEPRCMCFIPDPNGQQIFIGLDGSARRGREVQDGLIGYHRHNCAMMPCHTILSDKEARNRCWA